MLLPLLAAEGPFQQQACTRDVYSDPVVSVVCANGQGALGSFSLMNSDPSDSICDPMTCLQCVAADP